MCLFVEDIRNMPYMMEDANFASATGREYVPHSTHSIRCRIRVEAVPEGVRLTHVPNGKSVLIEGDDVNALTRVLREAADIERPLDLTVPSTISKASYVDAMTQKNTHTSDSSTHDV